MDMTFMNSIRNMIMLPLSKLGGRSPEGRIGQRQVRIEWNRPRDENVAMKNPHQIGDAETTEHEHTVDTVAGLR